METGTLNRTQPTFNVIHEVADFDKWHVRYLQNSKPEDRIAVLRNYDNPNLIMVGEKTASHDAARAFLESDELKSTMKDAGVVSAPEVRLLNMIQFDPTYSEGEFRVSISHNVANFDAWKLAFDEDESRRKEAGIHTTGLGTSEDNPEEVFVMFGAKNIDSAKAYFDNPRIKDLMQDAGVVSTPKFNYWQ